MRLLNVHTLHFTEFHVPNIPKYAVTSHRWTDDEITIKDVIKRRDTHRVGWRKLLGFCRFVRQHLANIEWLWMDTCCIDQKSGLEVQECVNSMFQWYSKAEACIAYLADVQLAPDNVEWNVQSFTQSVWWTRGWTLQELLAPNTVLFLDNNGHIIDYTGRATELPAIANVGVDLNYLASTITGIPVQVLHDYHQSINLTVEDRMKWMANRRTTKPEDMAYCLLGIFEVYMSLIYGEGMEEALSRLQEAIERKQDRRNGWGSDRTMYNVARPPKPLVDHLGPPPLPRPPYHGKVDGYLQPPIYGQEQDRSLTWLSKEPLGNYDIQQQRPLDAFPSMPQTLATGLAQPSPSTMKKRGRPSKAEMQARREAAMAEIERLQDDAFSLEDWFNKTRNAAFSNVPGSNSYIPININELQGLSNSASELPWRHDSILHPNNEWQIQKSFGPKDFVHNGPKTHSTMSLES